MMKETRALIPSTDAAVIKTITKETRFGGAVNACATIDVQPKFWIVGGRNNEKLCMTLVSTIQIGNLDLAESGMSKKNHAREHSQVLGLMGAILTQCLSKSSSPTSSSTIEP